MSLNETMTKLMDASRNVYSGSDKRSIADLTNLMLNPSSANVLFDSNSAMTLQGVTMSSADDATLITVAGPIDPSNVSSNRFYVYAGDGVTINDQMAFIMIARTSPKASASSIPLRIGGYDNAVSLAISSSDWKLYRVPLNNSNSPNFSIYFEQQGPTIEYKYFALVKVGN